MILHGIANKIDEAVARRIPGRCPFILCAEFPRSGGNWIRDVVADYLQIPVSRRNVLPTSTHALVQTHTGMPLERGKCLYNLRDGRDVFVSHFWRAVRLVKGPETVAVRRILGLHPSLKKVGVMGDEALMTTFYDEWRIRPYGSRTPWGAHVEAWLRSTNPERLVLRYEDVLERPETTLPAVAERLIGKLPSDYVLDFAVRRNGFEERTGRKPGQIDPNSDKRAGIVGGWKQSLPPALQCRFLDDFGATLELADYETDVIAP